MNKFIEINIFEAFKKANLAIEAEIKTAYYTGGNEYSLQETASRKVLANIEGIAKTFAMFMDSAKSNGGFRNIYSEFKPTIEQTEEDDEFINWHGIFKSYADNMLETITKCKRTSNDAVSACLQRIIGQVSTMNVILGIQKEEGT